MRDPLRQKVGRNEPCWCGSRLKYKRCHYQRNEQAPHEVGRFQSAFYQATKETEFCSCSYDSKNCSGKIVESHSVSKASSLSMIAAGGHVTTIEYEFGADGPLEEIISFRKIGLRRASTAKAFCAHHDARLFRQLDQFQLADEGMFFWQLLYRSACFERYRKVIAAKFSPQMRAADRGLALDNQAAWQDLVSRHEIGHSAGFRQLDRLCGTLEAVYRAGKCSESLVYAYFRIPEKLPLAAAGAFQPDVSPDGTRLQVVNRMRMVDGVVEDYALDALCMAILPRETETLLAFCALREHVKSIQFIKAFCDAATATVDSFVGVVLAKIENVYFDPRYIGSLTALGRRKLKTLHSFGVGTDLNPDQISLAMRLGLFAPYVKLDPVVNF